MIEQLLWFVLVVILVSVTVNYFIATKHLPPGPFPLPIIGNAHKLAANSRHVDLMQLEKQYGKVFRLYLGSQLVVVVGGGDAIQEVLVTRSSNFAGRPSIHSSEVYSKGRAIGFADYSSEWRLHRKLALSALKLYGAGGIKQEAIVTNELTCLWNVSAPEMGSPMISPER